LKETTMDPKITATAELPPEQRACRQSTSRESSGAYFARKRRRPDEEQHADRCHPGLEYATTEGRRKAWDDVDTPPDGDGWVRNVHAGRDGWERFDYTEESYWMRPKEARS
jgi:hypothetical protein